MYNDYQLADNLSAKAMRQKFQSLQGLEGKDIAEIYEKLAEQREFLKENNHNGEYDKIITKIDESLAELDEILKHENIEKPAYKAGNLMGFLARQKHKSRAQNTMDNTAESIAPNETANEDSDMENTGENADIIPPTDSNPDGLDISEDANNDGLDSGSNGSSDSGENQQNGDTLPNNNVTKPQNTYKRNFPMPGSILYRLSQSLFVSRHSQQSKKEHTHLQNRSNTYSNLAYEAQTHSNALQHTNNFPYPPIHNNLPCDRPCNPQYPNARPHDPQGIPPMHEWAYNSHCDPREKCVTNQLDILRLMLLFMTLRPTCRYMPRMCRVATTQLDILGEMMK